MANNDGNLTTSLPMSDSDEAPDFTIDDLILLKEIFLALEKAIDEIQITKSDGDTFQGGYIFSLLEKANVYFWVLFNENLI